MSFPLDVLCTCAADGAEKSHDETRNTGAPVFTHNLVDQLLRQTIAGFLVHMPETDPLSDGVPGGVVQWDRRRAEPEPLTLQRNAIRLDDRCVNADPKTKPRMSWDSSSQNLGSLGVLKRCCIMAAWSAFAMRN